jgi:DtxR family Mn-dependent transcriptional regulator
MASSTVENYLKQLYLEERGRPGELILMGRLAAAMGVTPGTATAMVKGLSKAGQVAYEPRGGVRLTPSGERLALDVLRRHRLVELFLVKVLGLDWSVVHAEADALEHALSDRVLDRIDALLGHPSTDPHGDPIPTPQGQVAEPPRISLADCPVGVPLRVARVVDQEPAFLQFVGRERLMPGSTVTVIQREAAADSVRLRTRGRRGVSLGLAAAARVLVEAPSSARRSRAPRQGR